MAQRIKLILVLLLSLLFISCNNDDLKKWFVTGDFSPPSLENFYFYKNTISKSNNTVIVGIQFNERIKPDSVVAYLVDEFNIKYQLKFFRENISSEGYVWIGYAEIPYETYSQNEVDFEISVEDAKDLSGNKLRKPSSYVLENTYKVLSRHKVFLEREYPLETNALNNTYEEMIDKQSEEEILLNQNEKKNNFSNEGAEESTINQKFERNPERTPSILIQKGGITIDYSQKDKELLQLKEPSVEVIDVFLLGNYVSKTNPYITVIIRVKSPKPIVKLVAYLVIQKATHYPLYMVNVSKIEDDYAVIASYQVDLSWIKDEMETWEFDVLVENVIDEESNYLANPFNKEGFKIYVGGRNN
ncbi:MAG: hypothetical protein QXR30_03565 [Candidatus Woesearchaeota archaeon]